MIKMHLKDWEMASEPIQFPVSRTYPRGMENVTLWTERLASPRGKATVGCSRS